MTRNYVKSTLRYLSDLQEKSTEISIKNLTVESLTAGGALISLLHETSSLTYIGVAHVVVIGAFVYAANTIIRVYYRNHVYKFNEADTIGDIEGA